MCLTIILLFIHLLLILYIIYCCRFFICFYCDLLICNCSLFIVAYYYRSRIHHVTGPVVRSDNYFLLFSFRICHSIIVIFCYVIKLCWLLYCNFHYNLNGMSVGITIKLNYSASVFSNYRYPIKEFWDLWSILLL